MDIVHRPVAGQATVERLVAEGHTVTAFSRRASIRFSASEQLTALDGDVLQLADVERAVQGHDAVIVTLGINENPLRVRLFGSAATALDVRSRGTRNVVAAMRKHGVSRLVVQSSYGVGETRKLLRLVDRLLFALLLKPQMADTELQEQTVRASGMDWVLAQPVHLVDVAGADGVAAEPYVATDGSTAAMKVARSSVARFLVRAALERGFIGRTVAVSGQEI